MTTPLFTFAVTADTHLNPVDGQSGSPWPSNAWANDRARWAVAEVPQQHAAWVPVTKTFRELGIDVDDLPPVLMASEIGQVPQDGGEYLPFLIEYRTIVEGDISRSDLIEALTALGKKHPSITTRLRSS